MADCACRSAFGRTKPLFSLHLLYLSRCGLGTGSVLPTPDWSRLSRSKGNANVCSRCSTIKSFASNPNANTTALISFNFFDAISAGVLKHATSVADPALQFDAGADRQLRLGIRGDCQTGLFPIVLYGSHRASRAIMRQRVQPSLRVPRSVARLALYSKRSTALADRRASHMRGDPPSPRCRRARCCDRRLHAGQIDRGGCRGTPGLAQAHEIFPIHRHTSRAENRP